MELLVLSTPDEMSNRSAARVQAVMELLPAALLLKGTSPQ